MSATTLGLDDKILDGIKAKITTHRDADKAINAALAYNIERDRSAPLQDLTAPLVNIELETDTPEGRDYTARIKIFCLVPTMTDDSAAYARLGLLKEQVRRALLAREGYDFGQAVGAIGKIARPSWARISFDDATMDSTILAGAWTIEITYAYEPDDLALVPLDEIAATVGKFSNLYTL